MRLIRPCPFRQPEMLCVAGNRYMPIDDGRLPEQPIHKDLPGLMFVGECTCCAKAATVGAS